MDDMDDMDDKDDVDMDMKRRLPSTRLLEPRGILGQIVASTC